MKKNTKNQYTNSSLENSNKRSKFAAKIDRLNEKVTKKLKKRLSFSSFLLCYENDNKFSVSVLFKKEKDIASSKKYHKELIDFVYSELEQQGFGKKDEINIKFYFESEEKLFSGEYTPKIPTEEELEHASDVIAENIRGLDEVCDKILKRFKKDGIHEIYLFYSRTHDTFGAYIFYRWDRQIKEASQSGLSDQIVTEIHEELEKIGRGSRKNIKVNFEFDSHENVEKNYEGDYLLRLR